MRVSKRAMAVSMAQTQLALMIHEFANEHDLTDIELLQGLNEAAQGTLKFMLRAERNPDRPDRAADIDYSEG
jgi:hypothetical protein